MNELPYIMFSSDTKIVFEHMVLYNTPEHMTCNELGDAFLAALASEERAAFQTFCSSDFVDTRIFPLINFYPFHFAFAEKIHIGSKIRNIVFLSENTEQLYPLMLPTSEALREVTNRLICETESSDGRKEEIKQLTPESVLAMTHIKNFDSFINSECKRTSYCDLHKLIVRVCESFSKKEIYSNIQFEISHRGTGQDIIEIPLAPFVYVICSIFALMHTLSSDRTLKVTTYKFAYAGEITIETRSSAFYKLHRVCSSLQDLASDFPSISLIAQSASVVSILSDLLLSVDVDRESDIIKVTLGAGFDYQSEPDFKFNDPYSDVDNITQEALDILDSIK